MTPTIVSSIAMYPHEIDYVKSLFSESRKSADFQVSKE